MNDIITKRLILNKIKISDTACLHGICSNEAVTTTFMMAETSTLMETRSIIDSIIEKYEDPSFNFWAIRTRKEKKLIGIILSYESGYLELGYAISPDYQNKGYATEALNSVTTYFFTMDNINHIVLGAFSNNYASIRVMEKCGYLFHTIKPHEFFYRGKSRDIVYFSKTK